MHRIGLALVLLLTAACASSYTPAANTREELVAYVDRAAALLERDGLDAACAAFNDPRWISGDWYVFVNDPNDVAVCHPVRADLVGRDLTDLRDANGVYLIREMAARVAGPDGRGWVEYVWPRPGETDPVPKSVYVVGVTAPDGKRYVVGSGGYEMP